MTDFPKSISFETALGRFDFNASVLPFDPTTKTLVSLNECRADYDLPDDLCVERSRAVVLRVKSKSPLLSLRFECRYRGEVQGRSSSGEGLDAYEWENDTHLVVVGTEDNEFLTRRMPFLTGLDDWVGEFSDNTMAIELNHLSTFGKEISFHFILAENPSPEPASGSARFAADLPHAKLRA